MSANPIPYTPPYQTIADRKINVSMKLGNRADLLQAAPGSGYTYSRISGWLRDAYIAVSTCRTFEQTEQTTTFQTVAGQDTYDLPPDLRAAKSFVGYDNTGTPIDVYWKDIAFIRRYNPGSQQNNNPGPTGTYNSRPSIYTFFGNNIIFRPPPDNAQGPFTFYLDYWQRPLITEDVDSTPLLLPDEWLEVVDYEAACRGNAELQQGDKSREIQQLLYGFTDPQTGRYVAGIIERLQNRNQAMAPYTDWGMQPQTGEGGYTR